MQIRPISNNEIYFPTKRNNTNRDRNMVEEPSKERSLFPPKWTDVIIKIPKKNAQIKK